MNKARRIVSESPLWLPFTANRVFKEQSIPKVVVSGSGMYYTDVTGRRILDASAGLWCSNAGISPRPVVEAVKKQLDDMSYAPSFQMVSERALDWASELVSERHTTLAHHDLDRVFFTLCGSSAIDTAMKMALAYHRANGAGSRTRFIGRHRGYHGVGFGGLSVGGILQNRTAFSSALLDADHLCDTHSPQPHANCIGQPAWGGHLAEDLENLVSLHGSGNIAAVVLEPVAGSTGVLVPPVGYLEKIREICTRHNLLLIFDEVITGFGRLGQPFASEHFDVYPDILTLAKGLTGAVVPAGAVIAKRKIYETITTGSDTAIEFPHGYTYSAHPVAAAAGLAMLKYYTEDGLYERAASLIPTFAELIHDFDSHGAVRDVRNIGLMGAIELKRPDSYELGDLGRRVMDHAWHCEQLYLRVTGDTIALSPAFVATPEELQDIFCRIRRCIDSCVP